MSVKAAVYAAIGSTVVLGATNANAQSSVQLYGTVDAFAGAVQVSGAGPRSAVVDSSGLTTSYWGMSGKEDLGAGLSAEFTLESFFRIDTGEGGRFGTNDTFFKRNSFVGLSSKYGAIKLGRNTTPFFISMLLFNPLQDSQTFSPMFLHTYTTPPGAPVTNTVAGDTGWDNSILYQSPAFGGLHINAIYSTGESPGHAGQQNYGANALWFVERFAATFAAQRVAKSSDFFNGADRQDAYLAGASYDFGVVKTYAQVLQSTSEFPGQASMRARSMQLGATVPMMGQSSLMVTWVRTWQRGNDTIADAKRDTATIAYDYPFSKRTDSYMVARYDKVSGLNTAISFGLGVRHKF